MTDVSTVRSPRRDPHREERLEVLRLLETGDISAAEADTLLDALDSPEPTRTREHGGFAGSGPAVGAPGAVRQMRIRITEAGTGKPTFNLALPIGLVEVGLNMARRFAPDKLPTAEVLRQAIATGTTGALVDVINDKDRVEIIFE